MFISTLSDVHVGYANVITLQIITRMYITYAKITDGGLEDDKDTLSAMYDVNMPIETLYKRTEEYVQYAVAANTPFSDTQIVSSAFRVIQKTGMFVDDCKE